MLNPEFLAVLLAVFTLLGSAVAFFLQKARDRREQKDADERSAGEIDRQQALERVREQLRLYVGPLHRLYKTQNTILQQYRLQHNTKTHLHYKVAMARKGRFHWAQCFSPESLAPFLENPHSPEAKIYRNMITRRQKPVYTRVRDLVLEHAANLADMPTQEEWLQEFTREAALSPYTFSVNANVIFDTYTAWTFEFDDIIENWTTEEDFTFMQPTTKVAWLIVDHVVDLLYDNAKEKEARYNKHVKVHKNFLHEEEALYRLLFSSGPRLP